MKALFLSLFVSIHVPSIALASPGNLDPSFGEDSRVFVDIPNDFDIAAIVLQQHDGKLVVGQFNGANDDDSLVLRFKADGSRDNGFDRSANDGGRVHS